MNNRNNYESSDSSWEGWDDHQVWDGINEALNKKAKRRLLPIFFYTVISAFILISLLFYMTNSMTNSKPKNHFAKHMKKENFELCHINEYSDWQPLCTNKNSQQHNQIIDKTNLKSYFFNRTKTQVSNKPVKNQIIKFDSKSSQKTFYNIIQETYNSQDEELKTLHTSPKKGIVIIEPIGQISRHSISSIIINNNQISNELQAKKSLTKNEVKKPGNKLRLDIYLDQGIGIGRRFESIDANIAWQNLNQKNEQYLYSTSHQLYGVKTFRNGWNISTGFSFIRHISHLQGKTQNVSTITFDSDSARVQEINDLTYYHSGQLTKTITKNEVYNVYNTHSLMQIPIQIGYAFSIKNNILRIAAGTNYTVVQFIKGYAFDAANHITSYDNLSHQSVKKSSGLNDLTSSVNLLFPMNKKIGLNFGFDLTIPTKNSLSISDGQSKDYQRSNAVFFIKVGMVYNIKNL